MMGMEWLVWVVVAVLVLRVLTGTRRRARGWLWYDGWWGDSREDGQLTARGRRARHLERRRAALEEAADRLEEAGERLRGRARGVFGPPAADRRPAVASSGAAGRSVSAGLSGSGAQRAPAPSRKRTDTPLAALQRRFAEGHITMEQYERELDKLYGLS